MNKYIVGREVQLCIGLLLLVALFNLPYGYYQFLRLSVLAGALFCIWKSLVEKRMLWSIVFCGLAILFNPLKPVYLQREEWMWVDVVVALIFISFKPRLGMKVDG